MSTRAPLRVVRIHLATTPSTNTFAREAAGSLDPAALTVVTADEQTAGRGRGARTWVSSGRDDLKATFAFRVPPPRLATAYLLSPLLAVAARRAVRGAGVSACSLKWPNDLIAGGARKVGGILCELESLPDGSFVALLGVGINVNSTPEALGVTRPAWPLSTLSAELGGRHIDVRALTDALCDEFAGILPTFLASGFAPFKAEYDAASVLLGKVIRFSLTAGEEEGTRATKDGSGNVTVEGRVCGMLEDGRLQLVLMGTGETRAFLSGEVCSIELAPGNVIAAPLEE